MCKIKTESYVRSVMCARNIEFSIFSPEEKAGFKRLKGAQSANGVQKNGLPKIYIFFEKIT